MQNLPKYKEVSDKKLKEMTAEEKIEEIKKAFEWLSSNSIKKESAKEHNWYMYTYFVDIVQRLVGWILIFL